MMHGTMNVKKNHCYLFARLQDIINQRALICKLRSKPHGVTLQKIVNSYSLAWKFIKFEYRLCHQTSVISGTYLKKNCENLRVLRFQKKNSGRRWTWIVGPLRGEQPKQHGTWRAVALWVDSGLGRDPVDAPPSWNLQHTGPPTLLCAGRSRCSEQQTVRTHLHQHQSEVLIQDDSQGFVTREPKGSVSKDLYCDRL